MQSVETLRAATTAPVIQDTREMGSHAVSLYSTVYTGTFGYFRIETDITKFVYDIVLILPLESTAGQKSKFMVSELR